MLPIANQVLDGTDVPQLGLEELTADNVATFCPQLYTELRTRFVAEGRRQGLAEERQRIEALVKGCHGNGERLLEAFTDGAVAAELLKSSGDELAADVDRLRRENTALHADIEDRRAAQLSDEELRAKFSAQQDLQDRFSCVEAYIAFLRHPAKK
jgi:hypothetical protein